LTKKICFSYEHIGDAAFSSGFATVINAAIVLDGRDSLSVGVQVAIGIGITAVWAIQNALRVDQQGWLNNFAAFFQISSSIVIVVVLFAMAPERATAKDVFTSTYNGTSFPFAYVCCISILSTLFSFSGYEGKGKRKRKFFNRNIWIFSSWCSFS
jgi:amino acid transporter